MLCGTLARRQLGLDLRQRTTAHISIGWIGAVMAIMPQLSGLLACLGEAEGIERAETNVS
jgi:hypothetical protein